MLINIKPLSVNQAWKGQRFRTDKYKKFQRDISLLLRPLTIPDGRLEIYLKFGFSSPLSDFDNPVKPFVDCLQNKYGFNDNRIKRAVIDIDDSVKKGKEFIEFELKSLEGKQNEINKI